MAPPEVCPEHDLRIDQYGCWACGHPGPITDEVFDSWYRWSTGRTIQALDWLVARRKRLRLSRTRV